MLELSDKNSKVAVITIPHEVKLNTLEIKRKVEIVSREIEIVKKSQMEII